MAESLAQSGVACQRRQSLPCVAYLLEYLIFHIYVIDNVLARENCISGSRAYILVEAPCRRPVLEAVPPRSWGRRRALAGGTWARHAEPRSFRRTCFCATKVIPEGNGVKAILQKDHITRKPLMLVHNGNINGIDTDYFSAEQVTAQHADIFTFIFIGRIVGDKGMNELADAIRQLKEDGKQFKVILVGNFETELDPLQGDNETFLRTAEEVEFVGYQKDVRPFLAQADALVFPSYREGFPNVVLQAGSMGLASIVTNISGCNEIIKDGLNGRIIQPRNTQALYHTMRYFIEHPAEVRRMAGNARGVVKEKFEQKDVWRCLLEEYRQLLP